MTPALLAAGLITCASPAVIDGDTLQCDGFRLRLWGVDAPERYTPEGPAATRALARLVVGQPLTCQRKGKSHDRIVARCLTPAGLDPAAELVRTGHARDWPKYSKGFYAIP